jgi:hypothetical protein
MYIYIYRAIKSQPEAELDNAPAELRPALPASAGTRA